MLNLRSYWLERGETYEADFQDGPEYAEQEEIIAEILGPLEFESVLDAGCGFGRIGQVIEAVHPGASYTGLDLSPDQIASARRRLPGGRFIVSPLADFIPDRTWDLVVAVELLMHIPPKQLGRSIRKLIALASRHVLTVDWDQPGLSEAARHNWCHDYTPWLGPPVARVGVQGIYYLRRDAA